MNIKEKNYACFICLETNIIDYNLQTFPCKNCYNKNNWIHTNCYKKMKQIYSKNNIPFVCPLCRDQEDFTIKIKNIKLNSNTYDDDEDNKSDTIK
jgi:hypothetical protein